MAEGVPLERIAAEVGTPVYVYAANAMRARYRALAEAFEGQDALVCYAVKANGNLAVLRLFADLGAGADAVSGGEVTRALRAGVPPERIVYAGVAKTDDEIRLALEAGILQFNAESVAEVERLSAVARGMGRMAPVALRVNPDVSAGGHDKISTGRRGDKFGIAIEEAPAVFRHADALPGVRCRGVHLHVGSQIQDAAPLAAAYAKGVDLFRGLRAAGHGLDTLDLGGGIGVRYRDEAPFDLEGLAAVVARLTEGLGCRLLFEPGRFLVAEAGVLLSKVIFVKETDGRRFLVLDAGMQTLVRPAMYGAWHGVRPVVERPDAGLLPTDVVGPICESSDVFGRDRMLPPLDRDDLVVLETAGAYGAVMASAYNSRVGVAEVLVDGDRFAVIRPPLSIEAQMAQERMPAWLEAGLEAGLGATA
ncbi:MAG: diaminopimelate decarboxylase [Geminicoccaceae bacterium]|nr:diaminopimelate decarboxylase [Geminicoccaceae bacterium]